MLGGFTVSISGHAFHSVGLDESHEMLINKHVKQAVVRPTKDYIDRIARYIPLRIQDIIVVIGVHVHDNALLF